MEHQSHNAMYKRQVAEAFLAGDTQHAPQRHDISRQLVGILIKGLRLSP